MRGSLDRWASRAIAVILALAALGAADPAPGAQAVPPQGKPNEPVRQTTPPPPASAPTASLSGRITSITDGKPIARARVIVSAREIFECPPDTPPGKSDDCPRYNRVELTNADGRYTVDKLPRGKTFVVTATKTGYAARAFGETPPAVPPRYVELKDGEAKENINIQLVPHNVIAGTLLDEDGTPFAGALVEALRAVYENGQRKFVTVADCVSDDRGQFRLFGLSPGQYFISAFDPAYSRVGDQLGQLFYGPTFYPGTAFQDDAVRVTLDPGVPVEGLKFKLQIIRPARITGKLLVSGLQLLAGAVNIGPSRNSRSVSFAATEADIKPDGVFQFANILAERYVIRARGEVERQGLSHFGQWIQPVEGKDISGVEMVLSPGALITGRVTWDGRLSRPPADESTIRVRAPMADGATFGDALTGTIGLDRTFALRGVMAGQHYIRVEGLPEPWRLKRVLWRGSDITDIPFDVDYGATYGEMEVILTDVYTTLSGLVSVRTNDLPQGYAVIAFPTNTLNWRPISRYIKLAYLDDRGRFLFRGLPPAEYFVAVTRAADESDLTNTALLDQLSRNAVTVRLSEGDRQSVYLRASAPKR